MSDLFAKYEDDFNNILTKIKKMTSIFSTLSREKAESALSNSIGLFKEGEDIIHQLEVESSVSGLNSLQNKVKQYKIEFQVLQNQFQSMQDNYISKKAENAIILGTDDNSTNDASKQQKHNEGLIDNEQLHKEEEDIKVETVEIQGGYDEKKFEVNRNIHDESHNNDDMIPDDNDLNMQYEKKNKKVLIISSISIIVILVLLIILLSVFL